jgi:hypothetical protein
MSGRDREKSHSAQASHAPTVSELSDRYSGKDQNPAEHNIGRDRFFGAVIHG